MNRPTFRATCAALTVALIAVTAACGVGLDEEPRALQAPATTTTISATPSTGRFEAVLYYVREATLLPEIQELPDRGLQSILTALLQPPAPATQISGLGTSIPSGTTLLSTQRSDGRLTIDLSAAFDNVVGLSRQQAIGQMVLTATETADLDSIVFEVEGSAITVSSPTRGDRTVVDACDFASLLATPEDAATAGLPTDSIEVLAERRAELDRQCD